MLGWLSCLGCKSTEDEEHEPLLPRYQDETTLQASVHEKLHSYQIIRAIGAGYMPSTEQLIANLRALLSADVLNPDNPNLSPSGAKLIKLVKQLLQHFITFLQHKNYEDEIQDFLWLLTQVRIGVDVQHLSRKASKAKAKADATAGSY
jgi:hypothetical protein